MNLSDAQVNDLASPLVGIITKFYEDPKNEEDFQKWLQQRKKINRHKLAVAQAYSIIALFMLFGLIAGFIVGRATAPPKVEKVTVTETVKVPTYDSSKLPEIGEITYYNVPLSHSLQRFIYEVCADENVPVSLVIAMIDHDSKFNPEVISATDDYGLMQINSINNEQLEEKYRAADMLDPYQNVFCGIKVLGAYIEKYEDLSYALMAYNMGEYGAKKAWESGVKFTSYSDSVLELMSNYEQGVKENAASSDNE